ncbi:2331_t:CDS:2 [Entrophospora sp. SA101]|nr:2331_t:CDS:2 [Entrophospora sp. SA101]
MSKIDEPIISNYEDDEEEHTMISFIPDLMRFGMTELTDDVIALLSKRVYDIAETMKDTEPMDEEDHKLVEMAFTKKDTDERKIWITGDSSYMLAKSGIDDVVPWAAARIVIYFSVVKSSIFPCFIIHVRIPFFTRNTKKVTESSDVKEQHALHQEQHALHQEQLKILWRDTERYLDPLTNSTCGAKLFLALLRSSIAHAGKEFLPNDGTIILEDIYHLPLPILIIQVLFECFQLFIWIGECFSQIYELHCDNIALSHLYYHLASMCSNELFINENDHGSLIIRKLVIKDLKSDNWGLAYLISLQKYLECVVYGSVYNIVNLELHKEISKALIKVSSSIKYFTLTGGLLCLPPETIGHFSNLVVLEILVNDNIEDLFRDMCMSATFKGLEILRIGSKLPSLNVLTQYCYQSLHYLATSISDVKDVRQILVSCEQLEGLYLDSYERKIDSEELFQILVNHYPAKFQNYVYSTNGIYPKLL